jgi:hypothetical protein
MAAAATMRPAPSAAATGLLSLLREDDEKLQVRAPLWLKNAVMCTAEWSASRHSRCPARDPGAFAFASNPFVSRSPFP